MHLLKLTTLIRRVYSDIERGLSIVERYGLQVLRLLVLPASLACPPRVSSLALPAVPQIDPIAESGLNDPVASEQVRRVAC